MSASRSPAFRPRPARATAKFAATVDLPTPPLPLPTAMMFFSLPCPGGRGAVCSLARGPRSMGLFYHSLPLLSLERVCYDKTTMRCGICSNRNRKRRERLWF